ncbi:MAG TPA: HAMP domain-containing histidine kinase [Clostridiales bacterium]|nr:HAMP domain-containing histidine kinase [Clostridiales bacterium]
MILSIALWVIAAFIFFSDRYNKINRWFAYCYLLASLGTLKEFFMDKVVPVLLYRYPQVEISAYVTANSYVTAFLYLVSPLCFITLSMKFSDLDKNNKKAFLMIQLLTVLIISVYLFIYPPAQFKFFQLNRVDFWYCMSLYNIGYAVIGSIIMFRSVKNESSHEIKRRKRIILEVLLLPYYYCIITIFVIHTLNLDGLKKIWKDNIYLVAAVLLFYIYIAYKEGFMGVKISFTKYDWHSEMQIANTSTQYINHMLKNHIAKISWSMDNIRKKLEDNQLEELDIIDRSMKQLVSFTEKTNKCFSPKIAGDELCCSTKLIYEALEACNAAHSNNIQVTIDNKDEVFIICDVQAIIEVIHNIIMNAFEAIAQNGSIDIASFYDKKSFCIKIADSGTGMTADQMKQIFKPFYTTKKNNTNFGVGLSYCKSVMQVHHGSIEVISDKNTGAQFILHFPLKRIKSKELAANG